MKPDIEIWDNAHEPSSLLLVTATAKRPKARRSIDDTPGLPTSTGEEVVWAATGEAFGLQSFGVTPAVHLSPLPIHYYLHLI